MRIRISLLCTLAVVGAAGLVIGAQQDGPAVPVADAAVTPQAPAADECSVDASVEASLDDLLTPAAGGPGCKRCKKGREWCGCTYEGKPRISCDPCCYQGPFDPIPVCFD